MSKNISKQPVKRQNDSSSQGVEAPKKKKLPQGVSSDKPTASIKASTKKSEEKDKKEARAASVKSNLDDLFGGISAAKKAKEAKAEAAIIEAKTAPKVKKVEPDSDDDMGFGRDSNVKQRKKTEEGWNIYSELELGINQGGDTDDCPFLCTCCR